MTEAYYPQKRGGWRSDEVSSGFLRFAARPFENTLDDQSESSTGDGEATHDIWLPYPSVVSTDTAIWDQGANDGFFGYTDADLIGGAGEAAQGVLSMLSFGLAGSGRRAMQDTEQMELSMAQFKMPQLRQRHYSWNLINREEGDGEVIATICRSFQASVYPVQAVGYFGNVRGNEQVQPPPMWDVAYAIPAEAPSHHINDDTPKADPMKTGSWRWHMDQFLSVLMSVSISPTQLTDGSMAAASDGFPLATTLKLSFLEVAQVVATNKWESIIPYSQATDAGSAVFGGGKGGMSDL